MSSGPADVRGGDPRSTAMPRAARDVEAETLLWALMHEALGRVSNVTGALV